MKKAEVVANLSILANVSIIITAALLCFVLIKHYVIPQREFSAEPRVVRDNSASRRQSLSDQIQPGAKFSFTGIDWAKNGKTLVMAVSDKCRFCSESAPFYQRLTKEHGKTALVALVPQTVDQGKAYLDQLNVQVDDVQQASLNSIGLRSTPTLLLVDRDGVVTNSWVGKLAATQEAEVLASVK